MPAGETGAVIELVVGIPAQHHVAEAESLLESGEKLVPLHVFAAHDAIDIENADLDVFNTAFVDQRPRIIGGPHLSRVH